MVISTFIDSKIKGLLIFRNYSTFSVSQKLPVDLRTSVRRNNKSLVVKRHPICLGNQTKPKVLYLSDGICSLALKVVSWKSLVVQF